MPNDKDFPPRQTPANSFANPELLSIVPRGAMKVVEVGCSTGAFANAYKRRSPESFYIGIDIDATYTALAAAHCDQAFCADIEDLNEEHLAAVGNADCWIFGDSLEHLRDPWRVLAHVRSTITPTGSVVACIPNSQHWSLFAKLATGDFFYEESGLLDRTHLRFFTRRTITDMFECAGFAVTSIVPRIFPHPACATVLPHIGELANAIGADPQQAMKDALAMQYVIHAAPR